MSPLYPKLYDAAAVRALEQRAITECGVAGAELMRRAAVACWQRLCERWPAARTLLVVCGSGNNGGDGYEIARLAQAAGWQTTVVQVGKIAQRGDAVAARAAWIDTPHATVMSFAGELPAAEVIVDALFGIGLSRAPQGEAAAAIAAVNLARSRGGKVLAVDLPSGLDASSGAAPGAVIDADLTVTLIGNKFGLHAGVGPDHAGGIQLELLELPEALHRTQAPLAQLQSANELRDFLPPRPRSAHKGSHGHVLLIGGNSGMSGAVLMAARAALRAGAGLVSVATRPEHAVSMAMAQPELMCHGIEDARQLLPLLQAASVVAIGPGLGQDNWAQGLYAQVLQCARPLIIDADALNLLARQPQPLLDAVLTPHPGEAARLLQQPTQTVQAGRIEAALELQSRYRATVVLKGAGSLIATGTGLYLCPYGNPGMGVGGMGDVLTGVIAALRAQGLDAAAAARCGVLIHALAGDAAAMAGQRGLLPTDLLAALRALVNPE
jgi:hydroxyethylthiazole kinase-like uncharacterized protein yjeF